MIDLSQTLNIAIVGKVNTGKSSLMNSLLKGNRRKALNLTKVSYVANTTQDFVIHKINDQVCLIDTPALNHRNLYDCKIAEILDHIHLGLFVTTLNKFEKLTFVQLKAYCKLFIIVNKIDEWDDFCYSTYDLFNISNQWISDLGPNNIYFTCTKGYDPTSRTSTMNIKGVFALRNDIYNFIEQKKNQKQEISRQKPPIFTSPIKKKTSQEKIQSSETHLNKIKEIDIKQDISTEDFKFALESCKNIARKSYEINLRHSQDVEKILRSLINNLRSNLPSKFPFSVDKTNNKEISNLFKQIIDQLEKILNQDIDKINSSLATKKEHLENYSIVIFGRTRSGKSTMREALTSGDGSTIGKGGQRTTREVQEYRWKELRLIDTPGIEAYEGEEDTAKANQAIDEADMVLFLTSDDSVQPGEFQAMAQLNQINKSFVVLLNVKAKVETPTQFRRFLNKPEKVFNDERLMGHHNHIRKYVSEHININEVQIINIHARAAFLSTQPEYKEYQSQLWQLSKLDQVYALIAQDICNYGIKRRASTFFDGTSVLITEIEEQISTFQDTIQTRIDFFQTKQKEINNLFFESIAYSNRKIETEINNLFAQFKQQIPLFVDNTVGHKNAENEWKQKISRFQKKLETSTKNLFEEILNDLKENLAEFKREYSYDNDNVKFYINFKNTYKDGFGDWLKNISLTFSGLTAAAMIATNWWNPAGWVVMGGWIATTVIGLFSRKVKQENNKKFNLKKENLKKELMRNIDKQKKQVIETSQKKLTSKLEEIKKEILFSIDSSRQELLSVHNQISNTQNQIKQILNEMQKDHSNLIKAFNKYN